VKQIATRCITVRLMSITFIFYSIMFTSISLALTDACRLSLLRPKR